MNATPLPPSRRRVRPGAALLLALALLLGAPAAAQEPDPEPPDAAAGSPDLAADAEARLRAGLELEGIPIGTRCVTPGAELDIAGIGHAVYDRIEVDTAEGRARLYGGVCIEVPGVDVVLRAASFEIRELALDGREPAGPPTVTARSARLDVGDWRLSVDAIAGSLDALSLRDVRLRSPGVVGRASSGTISAAGDGYEGTLRLVSMATHDYRIDARIARLVGDSLLLQEATGTTCVCGSPRFVLLGDSVVADLAGGGARIRGAAVRVLGVRVPLVGDLELGGEGPQPELPFAVAGREDLGTIAILRGRPADGVRVEVGAATEPVLWPLAVLEARDGGDRARFEVDGRGVRLDARRQRALGGGLWAAALSETVLRGDEPRLRGGGEVGWDGRLEHEPLEGLSLVHEASARVGAEVAVEPAGVADAPGDVGSGAATPRLPFAAEARTTAAFGGGVRAGLRTAVDAVAYPVAPEPGRLAVTLAPSLSIAGRDARLALGAQRRFTAGAGPFEFDAVEPRARLTADLDVSWEALVVDARAAWRLAPETPGAEELRLRAHADLPIGGGWTLRPALRAELAGLAGGPGDEDWIEAEVAAWHGEDTRITLRAREGLDPGELRDLVLGAQAPIRVLPSLRAVPYLAVDFAPLASGGGPVLHGHGLRLYVDDCCGTFVVGYRAVEDEWRFEIDVRLPPLDLGEPPLDESVLNEVPLGLPSGEPLAPAPDGGGPGGPVPRGPGGPVPLPEPPAPAPEDGAPDGPGPAEDGAPDAPGTGEDGASRGMGDDGTLGAAARGGYGGRP